MGQNHACLADDTDGSEGESENENENEYEYGYAMSNGSAAPFRIHARTPKKTPTPKADPPHRTKRSQRRRMVLQPLQTLCVWERLNAEANDDARSAQYAECGLTTLAEKLPESVTTDLFNLVMNEFDRRVEVLTDDAEVTEWHITNASWKSFKIRGQNRFDFLLLRNQHQELYDRFLTEEAPWMPLVFKLLGDEVVPPVHIACMLSRPGAGNQGVHTDGPFLEAAKESGAPPQAINIFIPLVTVTKELGPTVFFPGTHVFAQSKTLVPPIQPELDAGEMLLFDYQIRHRGSANKSAEEDRPILYLSFVTPAYREAGFAAQNDGHTTVGEAGAQFKTFPGEEGGEEGGAESTIWRNPQATD